MKTTLDLPDDLMREIRILAAREDRRMKDIITESLRRDLGLEEPAPRPSVRTVAPVSLGRVLEQGGDRDLLGHMLDERGHRY
jgi:plasmid stability protein